MSYFKCIQKVRDNNNVIIYYAIIDEFGKVKKFESNELRQLMITNEIEIRNLKLSSDNKIIDKHVTKEDRKTVENSLKGYIAKAKFVAPDRLKIYNNGIHLISVNKDLMILYIPKGITNIPYEVKLKFIEHTGVLHMIGGEDLESTDELFYGFHCLYLNIDYLDTSNVTSMKNMFKKCDIDYISLSEMDTSKVTNMCCMFQCCKTKYLDISRLNTSNVIDMREMFGMCVCSCLDFSKFDTKKVKDMSRMFRRAKYRSIDISSFYTPNLIRANDMFVESEIVRLRLDNMIISYSTDVTDMFYDSNILYATINDPKIKKEFFKYRY